ncbi:MAG: D-alanyl-D-alanine carboxypeptidase family protein [Ruminococcus sp.]|nr:D-alanyl-D-alanine carboxypeptidase family protein [Ruminococcus sp.]
MAKQKIRLRFPNIILLLCGLIILIFLFDFLWRNVISPTVPGDTDGIVTADGTFSANNTDVDDLDITTEPTSEKSTEATDASSENTTEDIFSQTIKLSQSQIHNGPLILVSGTCPYLGTSELTDFYSNTNSNVKPRDNSLKIHPDMMQPISELFDGYCSENGYVNLQIYSTNETYFGSDSLYTTDLVERSTGYTFDIGLITSTGDIAPYLTKRNEWMFSNCWKYGFIVRYSDSKAGTTGVSFMPHHFRYTGLPHSLIMNENDMCLEEYLQYLTSYKTDSPLTYNTDSKEYKIFYVPANSSGDTEITLPKNTVYTVSGNNTDGFIITIESEKSASSPDPSEPVSSTEAPSDAISDTTSSISDQYTGY